MIDLLLEIGVSNLCLSLALALVAWAVQARGKRPLVAHLLWMLVLAKLVTPPIVTFPVLAIPGLSSANAEVSVVSAAPLDGLVALGPDAATTELEGARPPSMASSLLLGKSGLALFWFLGSACVLVWSLARIWRFNRLLGMACKRVPEALQDSAARIGRRLGLARMPTILSTSAQLSPMVWWVGGRVRIVIPASLMREMDAEGLRWILAHELAHVRRRDHMVRWLEWLACVAFWWNPVAWWARRNLRANEEVCCDALVLSSLKPNPHTYANSLLNAVEFLASPVLRPPAMASEINSGGFLERRLRMIVSKQSLLSTPRWLKAAILFAAVGLLPLGVAYAQDYDAVGKRLREAVVSGELSREQAGVMMDALRRSASPETGERDARRITREEYAEIAKKHELAVAAGRISKEDSRIRLEAARKMIAVPSDRAPRRISREEFAGVAKRVEQAFAEGRISKEDARLRLEAARKMIAVPSDRAPQHISRDEYADLVKKTKQAVAEGKVSPDDARLHLDRARRMIVAESDRAPKRLTREDYVNAETKLKQAVADGKLSGEEARAKLEALRRSMAKQSDHREGPDLDELRRGLGERVESGAMTREEAAEYMAGVRRRMGLAEEGADERTRRYKELEAQIRTATREGWLTREEAAIKLERIRMRLFPEHDVDPKADYKAAVERIKAAVARGDVSRGDAAKRLEFMEQKLKKQAGGDDSHE